MAAISHRNKYIFVHTFKTAGTSIKNALRNRRSTIEKGYDTLIRKAKDGCSILGADPSLLNQFERFFTIQGHPTASELADRVSEEIWGKYFSFAFVRNPWDWQVSLYSYMREEPEHYQHDIVTAMDDFEEYIEWRVSEDMRLQEEYVVDENGDVIVDYVGKLRTINEDFNHICDKIGLSDAHLPHKNKSDHKHYSEYYNDYTRELVAEHFAPDISRFGFEFENRTLSAP